MLRRKRKKDNRQRRDRLLNHVEGFEVQLKEAASAYMEWNASRNGSSLEFEAKTAEEGVEGDYEVQVLDTYRECLAIFCGLCA